MREADSTLYGESCPGHSADYFISRPVLFQFLHLLTPK